MFFASIVFALLSVSSIEGSLDDVDIFKGSRIVGGIPAQPNQFPHVVHITAHVISSDQILQCGGSLIAPNWVLTAAQCLNGFYGAKTVTVRLGGVDRENPALTIETNRYIIHSRYVPSYKQNNIALIDLQQNVTLSDNIKLIQLPRRSRMSETYYDQIATLPGWGNRTGESSIMHYINVTVWARVPCQNYHTVPYVNEYNLCTQSESPKTHCSGDEGGPLTLIDDTGDLIQIGVTTHLSPFNCESKSPTIYTRPEYFWDWIHDWTGVPIRE